MAVKVTVTYSGTEEEVRSIQAVGRYLLIPNDVKIAYEIIEEDKKEEDL